MACTDHNADRFIEPRYSSADIAIQSIRSDAQTDLSQLDANARAFIKQCGDEAVLDEKSENRTQFMVWFDRQKDHDAKFALACIAEPERADIEPVEGLITDVGMEEEWNVKFIESEARIAARVEQGGGNVDAPKNPYLATTHRAGKERCWAEAKKFYLAWIQESADKHAKARKRCDSDTTERHTKKAAE
jgi:hypothetical protein